MVELHLDFYLVNPVANGSNALSLDVGSVSHQGKATFNNATGAYTLKGSGDGLGTSCHHDGYHLAYVPVTGDFTFIAQVTSQEGGGESGIIVKDDIAPWSSHVAVVLKSGEEVKAEYNTGSSVEKLIGRDKSQKKSPIQIGIVRSGSTFTEYEWKDNAWSELGTISFPTAPATLYLGLVESSDDNRITATGKFDQIQLYPYAE
jgi:hypothetical protein